MGIELSDDDLGAIRTHATDRLYAALQAYEWLRGALREKLPTVTDEAVAAAKDRIATGTHQDDGQETTRATYFCALFELAVSRGKECIVTLKAGGADSQILHNLMLVSSTAFEMLTRLAITLNGGPLAQRITDQQLSAIRSSGASHAADVRHSQPGGSRDKHQQLRDAWASGKYKTRDDCAEKAGKELGMPFSTARRALQNTPEPTRT